MRTQALLPLGGLALAALVVGLAGCPSGGGGGAAGLAAKFPNASKKQTTPLPGTVSWTGVYFINTPGTRGTMHLFAGADDKAHGCWMAEDKHAKATFVAVVKDNMVMFDWTEKKIGFAGAPTRIAAYLMLEPDPEGRHRVKGEYGENLENDGGSTWEGIRQKNQEPKEDGCKIEEGETIPTENKPLD